MPTYITVNKLVIKQNKNNNADKLYALCDICGVKVKIQLLEYDEEIFSNATAFKIADSIKSKHDEKIKNYVIKIDEGAIANDVIRKELLGTKQIITDPARLFKLIERR